MSVRAMVAEHAPGLLEWVREGRRWWELSLVQGGTIWRGPRDKPRVALTFDDGPDPRWTPAIVEALDAAGAQGTFFFLGSAVEQYPDLAREVARRHQVGTHLYSHDRAMVDDLDAFAGELSRALAAHEQALSCRPTALRFPWGYSGRVRARHLKPHGLTAYHWTLCSRDGVTELPEVVVDRVVTGAHPGSIVLLHDGRGANSQFGPGHRQATVDALPSVLAGLAERGLKSVTLDELLAPAD